MSRLVKTSTRTFAQALQEQPESGLRLIKLGPFVIAWSGKSSDFTPTVDTDEFFSEVAKR